MPGEGPGLRAQSPEVGPGERVRPGLTAISPTKLAVAPAWALGPTPWALTDVR